MRQHYFQWKVKLIFSVPKKINPLKHADWQAITSLNWNQHSNVKNDRRWSHNFFPWPTQSRFKGVSWVHNLMDMLSSQCLVSLSALNTLHNVHNYYWDVIIIIVTSYKRQFECLFKSLVKRTTKKILMLHFTGRLLWGGSFSEIPHKMLIMREKLFPFHDVTMFKLSKEPHNKTAT